MKKQSIGMGGFILLLLIAVLSLFVDSDEEGSIIETEPGGNGQTAVPRPITLTPNPNATDDWYELYFTDPTCPPEEERQGGLDETIAADLLTATQQVDIAAYDLDAPPIVNALIELEKQGVVVRVVTDTDNADQTSINRLRRNGISVVEDKRSGLMHNKFIVIDGRTVYAGSLNFTTNDVYCHNNNLVRIESPLLAENYTAEMDEMYIGRVFGPTSLDATPREQLTIGGVTVENYFGSEKRISPIIAAAITQARQEILFMAFSFTDGQVGEAMLGRADAGIPVQGVFENVGANTEFSYYPKMNAAGLDNVQVRTDGNPRNMHHKVIIIDRQTVVFGSFNFSDSANTRNDENILIVHDPTFANYFVEEFFTVWEEAGE
jgi:phosphatidylserine/phosphatidylglycerophosphate/cardiolipin synthase-like enzyme